MKILVVTAHPDDVDFGAGGTVATWISEGNEVVYCLVTDGQAGGSDNTVTRDEVAALRRREQTAAANMLGVTELHWLGFPDGAVVADLNLRREISAVIRILKFLMSVGSLLLLRRLRLLIREAQFQLEQLCLVAT